MRKLLLVVLLAMLPRLGFAQVVTDPRLAEFDPSPDHSTEKVSNYDLCIYMAGAQEPFMFTGMGKPSPEADGKIRYDFSSQVAGWPLPGGIYEARVRVIGPDGSAYSEPSNQFNFSSGQTCSYAVSPDTLSVPADGGTYAIAVTAQAGCAWSAWTSSQWFVLGVSGGEGNGTVPVVVDSNASIVSRDEVVTVADKAVTVYQAGQPCRYALSPTSASYGYAGGTATFNVITQDGCPWTATTAFPWIVIQSAANNAVSLNILANTSTSSRTGTVMVEGQAFTVNEAGLPPPPPTVYRLTIQRPSGGTVKAPGYLNCGTRANGCLVTFTSPTTITLRAVPDKGYRFVAWTGACADAVGSPTNVLVNRDLICGATFTR